MIKNRVHWVVTNQTSEPVSLGLVGIPAVVPGKPVDILLYTTQEAASQSTNIKELLDNGSITISKNIDSTVIQVVNSSNSFNGLISAEKSELTTGGGGGGNPFDQSLNTTDDVHFNTVTINSAAEISVYQNGGQNQMAFNVGEQGFSMGFDTNRAVPAIQLFGNNLYMSSGQGSGGSGFYMDGASIYFSDMNGDYGAPASIGHGTVDNGQNGGISLFCFATYELNWQGGLLTINGPTNGGGSIANLSSLSGPITGSPVSATASLNFASQTATDGQLIVLTYGTGGAAVVFTYQTTPAAANDFNFDTGGGHFLSDVVNTWGGGVTAVYDGVSTITFMVTAPGTGGNQSNGNTLGGVTLTDFTGGSAGAQTVTVNSNLVVNGTLAFSLPAIKLTETDNGINLGPDYDVYFLYVGPDNTQFTVNLPDPSTMYGRELTFINSGLQQEFYPTIAGNIQTTPGNQYNLSNNTVKFLSDGTTWWITSQV